MQFLAEDVSNAFAYGALGICGGIETQTPKFSMPDASRHDVSSSLDRAESVTDFLCETQTPSGDYDLLNDTMH